MNTERRPLIATPRFTPLWGVALGAVGGAVYWTGTQLWPASIAVVLSMAAIALIDAGLGEKVPLRAQPADASNPAAPVLVLVFAILIKYDALVALSSASLPYPLPANLALGLIMVAGQAASRALLVSLPASARSGSAATSHADVGIALALGFAPAAFIGIPGLVGLVAAIAARFAIVLYRRPGRSATGAAPGAAVRVGDLGHIQQATEICFYLGALASWAYL